VAKQEFWWIIVERGEMRQIEAEMSMFLVDKLNFI
jgi:hypothetical protein